MTMVETKLQTKVKIRKIPPKWKRESFPDSWKIETDASVRCALHALKEKNHSNGRYSVRKKRTKDGGMPNPIDI